MDAAVAPDASRTASPATPYKGLSPYDESDAPFFFGREVWSEILTDNLKAYRLTLLYGESGVGKSSVLRAGVARALRAEGARNQAEDGKPGLAVVVFGAWRQDPEAALVRALDEAGGEDEANDHGSVAAGTLDAAIESCSRRVRGRVFLILDQFEEYFLYHPPDEAGDGFAAALPRAIARNDLRLSVLIAIREDAVARLDRFKGRIPKLFDNYLRIEHLDRASARDAIERPLDRFHADHPGAGPAAIEPALVDAVLDEVEAGKLEVGQTGGGRPGGSGGQVETPYLQLVLTRLWAEEEGAGAETLRLATLERLGGAQGIVSSHLDAAMEALPPDERDIAAAAFRYLVTRSRTKIAHSARDLADWTEVPEDRLTPVLERLCGSGARILRPGGEGTYEIFHDVLADAVLTWRSTHEAGRRVIEERREAEAANRRRLYRIAAVAGVIAFAVVAVLAFLANAARHDANADRNEARAELKAATAQRNEATRQVDIAVSERLATNAAAVGDTDLELGVLLAREAWRRAQTGKAAEALSDAVAKVTARLPFRGDARKMEFATYNADGSRILSLSGGANVLWDAATRRPIATVTMSREGDAGPRGFFEPSAEFSGDGKRVLTQDGPRRLAVWDAATGDKIATTRLQSAAYYLTPNHDASLVVDSGRRGVRIWRVSTGKLVRRLAAPGAASSPQFTADGRRIVVTTYRGGVRIWPASGSRPPLVIRGTGDSYRTQAYVDPRATRLYVADESQRPQLISLATRRPIGGDFERAPDDTRFVSFSDDGRRFATMHGTRVKVWNAATGALIATSAGTGAKVSDAALTPDGRTVALQTDEGALRIWDVGERSTIPVRGPVGEGYGALAFDPGGRHLISTGTPSGGEIWDIGAVRHSMRTLPARGRGTPFGHYAFAMRPQGDMLSTAGAHGVTRLWSTETGRRIDVLPGGGRDRDPDVAHVFNPGGSLLLTAGADGTTRLWSVRRGRLVARMRAGADTITDAAFSPDGRLIATSGSDGRTRLWRGGSSRPLRTLLGRHGEVLSVAFSPDGASVVTANADKTAQIWDAGTGRPGTVLHPGQRLKRERGTFVPYPDVQVNADGDRVLMLGRDGAIRLWDTGGRLLEEVRGRGGDLINHAVFSADGERIAAGSDDKSVHIYDGRTGAELTALCCLNEATQANFSPDGSMVVGAGSNGLVLAWDAEDGRQLAVLERRGFVAVNSARFTADARRIVMTAAGGDARISDCPTCRPTSELYDDAAQYVGRSLTPGERKSYLDENAKTGG